MDQYQPNYVITKNVSERVVAVEESQNLHKHPLIIKWISVEYDIVMRVLHYIRLEKCIRIWKLETTEMLGSRNMQNKVFWS